MVVGTHPPTPKHTHKPSGKPVRLPFQEGVGGWGGIQAATAQCETVNQPDSEIFSQLTKIDQNDHQNRSKPFRPRSTYTWIYPQPTKIDENDHQNRSKPLKTVQTALYVHLDLLPTDRNRPK